MVALLMILAGTASAWAQLKYNSPETTGVAKFGPVRQLLVDGFEIKTGFSDNNGGAYMILQKATSAYLCHSSPNQVCEKLN